MTKLSHTLSRRVGDESGSQKDLATRFHTKHTKLAKAAKEKALEWTTVESKFSKLLTGEPEGEKFFFADPLRARALAEVFNLTLDRLEALRAARTILLDPRLPGAAVAYLRDRAGADDGLHWCEELGATPAAPPPATAAENRARIQKQLIEAAKASGALVVGLAEELDAFKLWDVEATTVDAHPRGWLLQSAPTLVPLPPPPPPDLWRDVLPMMPDAQHEAATRASLTTLEPHRRERNPDVQRLSEQDARGEQVTFSVMNRGRARLGDSSVTWVEPEARSWQDRRDDHSLAAHCFEFLHGDTASTQVWTHARKIFAVGPAAAKVGEFLAPYHHLSEPAFLGAWKAAIEGWNMWRSLFSVPSADGRRCENGGDARWAELARRVKVESGIDIEGVRGNWIERRDRLVARPDRVVAHGARQPDVAQRGAVLDKLLQREFHLETKDLSQIFRLQRIRAARFLQLPRGPKDSLHLVADLGAGHVVRLQVLEFPTEEPREIELLRGALDGGDVRIVVDPLPLDTLLEGGSAVAPRRRAQAAAEAAAASSYDDDDD